MVGLGAGIAGACLAAGFFAWFREVRAPRRIVWRPTTIDGIPAMVADGLVLQHDGGRTVWATRGFALYRSEDGGAFERVLSLRPRPGWAWGGYLASLRRRFGYQELVEVLPLGSERLVVFAAGEIHVVDLETGETERTHRLRYFGRGKGRGLMAFGLTRGREGAIFFGEYTTEPGDHAVCIWKSSDEGMTWHKAFEFPAGAVRHIHTVQLDPYGGGLWLGTGDRNDECYVGVSDDGAASFRWLAHGAQACRTCGFVFFPDVVLWGMDADHKPNRVMRLHRERGTIEERAALPGVTFYHRKLDDSRALFGLARRVAEVWVVSADGDACRWLGWSVPPEASRGPGAGVRLGRGGTEDGADGFVHVNPIRTVEHEAAIFRIAKGAAPHPSGAERADRD